MVFNLHLQIARQTRRFVPPVDERATTAKMTGRSLIDIKGQDQEEFPGLPQINQAQLHDFNSSDAVKV